MNYEKFADAAVALDNSIRDNVALKSFIVEASSAMMGDQSEETRQSIQDFLDAPMGDKKELIMKKAVAAAMVLAKDKGLMPAPASGAEIAAVVDEGLTRAKVAYQVGLGIINPEKAIDTIVDHAESRAIAVVEQAFDSGAVREVAAEGIVRLAYAIPEIGPIVGPIAQNYKPIIKAVISKVEKPVKEFIKTGIRYVSTTAKNIAHAAVEKAKTAAVSVAKKFVSLLAS